MRWDNIKLWGIKLILAKVLKFNINQVNNKIVYKNLYTILNIRFYSTINSIKLNPWFITGFTDAEGNFNMIVAKSSSINIGWRVQARFIIELHIKDISTLNMIQSFFGGIGNITINQNRNSTRFIIVNLNDLVKFIIPHFNNYPLQSNKKIDFESWKECIKIMSNKKHLTQEGLKQIVALKGILNLGLSDQLKIEFSDIVSLIRPSYICNEDALDPNWISGFIEGDGSFFITIKPLKNYVKAVVSIGLNIREKSLLLKIQQFFNGMGGVYNTNWDVVEWKVSKLSYLKLII